MGLLTGALQIGKSALLAYQSSLQITGNNISNAGSSTYTRQTPILNPINGVHLPEGFMPGGGVALDALRRNVDESLLNRLRVAVGQQEQSLVEQQTIGRIEGVLHELSDTDISSLLQEFFNTASALQNQPHDYASRGVLLTSAESLIGEIRRQRETVLEMREDLNNDIETAATEAHELGTKIAGLNVRIAELESTGKGGASALRDQRDQVLKDLAEIIQIEVREQPDGSLNVYAASELLIQSGVFRGITSTRELENGEPQVMVRFADNNGPIDAGNARLGGLVNSRDQLVMEQVSQLDSFTAGLIAEVNKVHAQGQGLEGLTDVVGTYDVLDTTAALNSTDAGLPWAPQNGSFLLKVTDTDSGTTNTSTITVDLDGVGTDESLDSLAAKINAVNDVTAVVTADNRLRITADDGYEITFGEDSSHALAALGINTFFTGRDAQDIEVNATLLANPNLVAAATQGTVGDGSNAANIAALGETGLSGLNGLSLTDLYNAVAADVAVKGAAANAAAEAAGAVTLSLSAQRESISGVSLDEETINLLRFERAFQGAARYTSTVDRLMQEMMALVG